MTDAPIGLLPVVAYVGTALLSGPLVLVAVLLGRFAGSFTTGLTYTGVTVGLGVLAALLAAALVVSPLAAGVALASFLGAALLLVALPVGIGRGVVSQYADCTDQEALRYAVYGWPPALLTSLGIFLAPGGAVRYNLTFLSGSVAALAWLALAAVVAFGPGVAGVWIWRLVGR